MSQTSLHQIKNQINIIQPRNENQKRLFKSIRENKLTFAIGSAGSGKTCVTTYLALKYILEEKYGRIVITRPNIEAGVRLGYLPGSPSRKLTPFMIPIYDEMKNVLCNPHYFSALMDRNRELVEILPLAFTRGRTFKDCFVIADEMSNATYDQLKMFLTRIGENCKIVITGDPTQSDLPGHKQGGLGIVLDKLSDCPDVGIVTFDEKDVVRSQLVQDILERLM